MSEYCFITCWRIAAPKAVVCDAIQDSLSWPQWWRGVEWVEELQAGREDGVGNIRRYCWKALLPYRIRFTITVTRSIRQALLEGEAAGDVQGTGIWYFSENGGVTDIRYEWRVRTTKRWMNWIAPLARPVFRRNHDWLMEQGGLGLAKWLDAALLEIRHGETSASGT